MNKELILNAENIVENCKYAEKSYLNSPVYCRLGLLDLAKSKAALECKNVTNCYCKQLIHQIRQENARIQKVEDTYHHYLLGREQELLRSENSCNEMLTKYLNTRDIKDSILETNQRYKDTLTKIYEIAKGIRSFHNPPCSKDIRYEMDIILKSIENLQVIQKGNKVKDLGQVPEWIKEHTRDIVLEGESILPYICDTNKKGSKDDNSN